MVNSYLLIVRSKSHDWIGFQHSKCSCFRSLNVADSFLLITSPLLKIMKQILDCLRHIFLQLEWFYRRTWEHSLLFLFHFEAFIMWASCINIIHYDVADVDTVSDTIQISLFGLSNENNFLLTTLFKKWKTPSNKEQADMSHTPIHTLRSKPISLPLLRIDTDARLTCLAWKVQINTQCATSKTITANV